MKCIYCKAAMVKSVQSHYCHSCGTQHYHTYSRGCYAALDRWVPCCSDWFYNLDVDLTRKYIELVTSLDIQRLAKNNIPYVNIWLGACK